MSRDKGHIPSETSVNSENGNSSSPEHVEAESSLGDAVVKLEMRTKVEYSQLPWGVWVMEKLGLCCFHPTLW